MPVPLLGLPLAVAVVLIVIGRLNHRARWGNRVALVGYALLAVTFVAGLALRR